ncbi:hypothetical protein T484DRAFT_3631129, partial [Baffinella frigidus]
HPKPETRNPKPETRNPKTENRNPKPETRNPKHPKPETRHPKPETRNPKPESRFAGAVRFLRKWRQRRRQVPHEAIQASRIKGHFKICGEMITFPYGCPCGNVIKC